MSEFLSHDLGAILARVISQKSAQRAKAIIIVQWPDNQLADALHEPCDVLLYAIVKQTPDSRFWNQAKIC